MRDDAIEDLNGNQPYIKRGCNGEYRTEILGRVRVSGAMIVVVVHDGDIVIGARVTLLLLSQHWIVRPRCDNRWTDGIIVLFTSFQDTRLSHSLGDKNSSKANIDRPSKYIPDAGSPIDHKTTHARHIGNARNAI